MQADYPTDGGVRPRLVCDRAQAEPGLGRLFLCASCRAQVIVCSCCDRGQVYCAGSCAAQARRQTLLDAGARFQASPSGRRAHAARMGRYRGRREIVTHHGSPPPGTDDLVTPDATTAVPDAAFPADGPRPPVPHCHWCGRRCLAQLRQGFLRRRRRYRDRVGHDRTGPVHHGDAA